MDGRGGGKRDRYLLGDSSPELAHLVAQAEVYAEATGVPTRLCDRRRAGVRRQINRRGCVSDAHVLANWACGPALRGLLPLRS